MLRIIAALLMAYPVFAQDSKSVVDAPAVAPEGIDTPFKPIPIPDRLFSPEVVYAANGGPFLAVGGSEARMKAFSVVNLKDGKVIATLQDNEMDKAALSPDGKRMAAVPRFGQKNIVKIYSVEKKKVETTIDLTERADRIQFASSDLLLVEHAFHRKMLVYDVSGVLKQTLEFDKFTHAPAFAASPGGNWLAVAKSDHLCAFNLKDGKEIRLMDYPKPDRFEIRASALAFSADGKLLAMVGDAAGKRYICILNLATGTPGEPVEITGINHGYRGTMVEGTPDGKGWLVQGNAMLEANSGQTIFRREEAQHFESAAHAISVNQILFARTSGQGKAVQAFRYDKAKVDAAIAAAKTGGNASDALRGNVMKANLAAAKTVTLPAMTPWKGASITPLRSVAGAGTNLPFPANEIGMMYVGGPDASILAVEKLKQGANPNDPGSLGFGVIDLKSGRTLGVGKFETPAKLLDVSPDGKSVLAVDASKPERLDVYGSDAKPKNAWRPYESEPEKGIVSAAFVDDARVVTLSKSGVVAVWNVAEAKAEVIVRDQTLKLSKLSPDRKVLAALTNEGLRLLSAVTLEPLGDTAPASIGTPKAIAFKGDGSEVAGFYQMPNRVEWTIRTWETATGKPKAALTFQHMGNFNEQSEFQYAGDYFLLDGKTLLDGKEGRPAWYYTTHTFDRSRVMNSPDERFMFPASPRFDQPSKLASTLMPDAQTAAAIQAAKNATDFALKPGSKIKVVYTSEGQFGGEIEKKLRAGVEGAVRAGKHTVGDGDYEYVIRVTEESTGQTEKYRMFGTGQTIEVPMYSVTIEATLMQGGRAVYKQAPRKVGMAQHMVRVPDKETDVAGYLRKQMWENVPNYAGGLGLPQMVARTPQGLIAYPGTTVLNDQGATVLKPAAVE